MKFVILKMMPDVNYAPNPEIVHVDNIIRVEDVYSRKDEQKKCKIYFIDKNYRFAPYSIMELTDILNGAAEE